MIARSVQLRPDVSLDQLQRVMAAAAHAGLGSWLHRGHLVLAGPEGTIQVFLAAALAIGITATVKPGQVAHG